MALMNNQSSTHMTPMAHPLTDIAILPLSETTPKATLCSFTYGSHRQHALLPFNMARGWKYYIFGILLWFEYRTLLPTNAGRKFANVNIINTRTLINKFVTARNTTAQ